MLSLRNDPTFSTNPKGAAVVLNAKFPWPAKIDLPNNFRPEVARALTEKDPAKFTSKMRKSFVARIYEYFAYIHCKSIREVTFNQYSFL